MEFNKRILFLNFSGTRRDSRFQNNGRTMMISRVSGSWTLLFDHLYWLQFTTMKLCLSLPQNSACQMQAANDNNAICVLISDFWMHSSKINDLVDLLRFHFILSRRSTHSSSAIHIFRMCIPWMHHYIAMTTVLLMMMMIVAYYNNPCIIHTLKLVVSLWNVLSQTTE